MLVLIRDSLISLEQRPHENDLASVVCLTEAGEEITFTILETKAGGRVFVGVTAPGSVRIDRAELRRPPSPSAPPRQFAGS